MGPQTIESEVIFSWWQTLQRWWFLSAPVHVEAGVMHVIRLRLVVHEENEFPPSSDDLVSGGLGITKHLEVEIIIFLKDVDSFLFSSPKQKGHCVTPTQRMNS